MRAYDLIWKKREGQEHSPEEIEFLVNGFVQGKIPDYQMSAWCMAVFFQGMTFQEATVLTIAMSNSGSKIDLSALPGIKVDKHSTGGVGDKTSLVLLPLVAAAGVRVAKMSGRGLGHTGGTIDKLESIPGFKTTLSQEAFLKQVARIGIALVGQSKELVPADKKLYALRDLTATIESIPLIASSIVSKKLAAGADAVILDVKYGDGAFMKEYQNARELAKTMVEIGNRAGRKFKAVLSDMNQPLGQAIGNSLEVSEAIRTLRGEGPEDLTKLALVLGGYLLWMAEMVKDPEAGEAVCLKLLESGAALNKLKELIIAQGGDPAVIDDPTLLPSAALIEPVYAKQDGWIERIDCKELGLAAMRLGAGRNKLEDQIKLEVGLRITAKIGDYVKQGSVIAEVHRGSTEDLSPIDLSQYFHFSGRSIEKPSIIKEII